MNKTAIKLLKFVTDCKRRQYYKEPDPEECRMKSRSIWNKYPEKDISKAMNHKACTSIESLITLLNAPPKKEPKRCEACNSVTFPYCCEEGNKQLN